MDTPVIFPRTPFDEKPYRGYAPEGSSLLDIVENVPNLPARFMTEGVVCLNGIPQDRRWWHRIKPKANSHERPKVVTLHLAPAGGLGKSKGGGKQGGGKSILTIIAAIAIVALAAFTGGGGLAFISPLLGAGTLGAALAAAAVSTLGMLALQALTPTPSVETETFKDRTRQDRNAFAEGNVISPGGIIPRVIGSHRIFPPLIATPLIDLQDDNEIVEAVYALAGPHAWEDIRIDGFPLEDSEDLEFQVREGWTDDNDMTIITRYGIVDTPQQEMTAHVVDDEVKRRLKHVNTPQIDLPVFHGFTLAPEPDEIWIQLIIPQGYYHQTDDGLIVRVPFRLRMRQEGQVSWINFPEVHLANRTSSVFRRMIRIKFVAGSGNVPSEPTPPTEFGWRSKFKSVPPQVTNNPGGVTSMGGWTANSFFDTGGAINTALNTHLTAQDATFYCYGATFNGDRRWEVQLIRGAPIRDNVFTPSTYFYNGLGTDVHDLFGYKLSDGSITDTVAGDPVVPHDFDNLLSTTALLRISAVYNQIPVRRRSTEQASGLALLVMKGRNKSLSRVSAQAAAYVPDWDGAEWANITTTSNPAPHFRDILCGELNYDATPTSIMDDDNLVEWRRYCNDNDLTCDLIAEGRSVAELLNTVAACGRAKVRFSDLVGVMTDGPRQQDSPIQLFSPRNSNGFRYDIPFGKRPDAYVVTYRDSERGYEENQIVVVDPSSSAETAESFESLTVEGITTEEKVTARMLFDIGQLDYRPATYRIETDLEYLACRRGDLIGLTHDVIQPRAGYARIKDIEVNAGLVESITIDNEVQLSTGIDFFAETNVFTEPDIFLLGTPFGCAIRLHDGSIITKSLTSTGLTTILEFATPFSLPANLIEDCLVVVGDVSEEYERFIIKELIPQADLTASLILVKEAPQLHPFFSEDFGGFSVGAGLPVGFTQRWQTTNISYAIQNAIANTGAASVSGRELLISPTVDDRRLVSFDAPGNLYTDVHVTLGIYIVHFAGNSSSQAGVVARGAGGIATETSVQLALLTTASGGQAGGLRLGKHLGGTPGTIAEAPFNWFTYTRYMMKISAIGSRFKAKIWQRVDALGVVTRSGLYNDFRDSQTYGWTESTNLTLTPGSTGLVITPTAADTQFRKRGVTIVGAVDFIVRVDIERTANRTSGSWDGHIFYETVARPFESGSFTKSFAEITLAMGRVQIELDMRSLDAGGTDWVDSIITGIRLDFDQATDGAFRVYSVTVGHPATAADLAEPEAWNIDAEDTTASSGPGWCGVFSNQEECNPTIDYISVQALEVQK
jgi:hypothetical protein